MELCRIFMYIKSRTKTPTNPARALSLKTATVFTNLSHLKTASINGKSPIATAAQQQDTCLSNQVSIPIQFT